MDWAKLLIGLVGLISSLVSWLKQNQYIDEGKSIQIAQALQDQVNRIGLAKTVQDEAQKTYEADATDSAFDPDSFRD